MSRILLGQLGANGDCLYATTLARQIRHDHVDAHITWAVSTQCLDAVRNNPHIDAVWEVKISDWREHAIMWRVFEREATRRLLRHEFDHAYLSQLWPNNMQHFDGTVRPSLFRSYGAPITVPVENVIVLDDQERNRVAAFVANTGLSSYEHRVLFECSPKSGQSFVSPAMAQEVASLIYKELPTACVIFSTHLPMALQHPNSRYAGVLSLRESAALTQHCTLFVGAGSGGTVAATSTASKQLPMIQLISASTSVYASFAHDFSYFGIPNEHIVEITNESRTHIAQAIVYACRHGIARAQQQFGEKIPITFAHYLSIIRTYLLAKQRYLDAAQSLQVTASRYGWLPELLAIGRKHIAPRLRCDPGWVHAPRRREGEAFLDLLEQAGAS